MVESVKIIMVTGYVCACTQGYSGVHCENRDFCTSTCAKIEMPV